MNFKHLRYFWAAAKAGGVMRAGEQLHTTPQTLSGQINQLEEWLGHELFRKRGRELELTNEGRIALGYAEQIFALSDELEKSIRLPRGQAKPLEFKVGWPTRSPNRWLTICWSPRWGYTNRCT